MNNAEDPAYELPLEFMDFFDRPTPRPIDNSMSDWFLSQYEYCGAVAFKWLGVFLYALALAGVAFFLWLAITDGGGDYVFDIAAQRVKSRFWRVWGMPLFMFGALSMLTIKIFSLKRERKALIDMLTHGVVASGRILDVERWGHGRFGTKYVAVLEYDRPDGITTVGRFTTLASSVGSRLEQYGRCKCQMKLLYAADETGRVVPLLSHSFCPI